MAILRVTSGPSAGEQLDIDGEIVIGREGVDLAIGDPELSRRHVSVRPDGDGVVIEDLGSTNGTIVDGERITEPVTVHRDASIKIGKTEMTVEVQSGATVMRASPTVMRSSPRPPAPDPSAGGPPPGAAPGAPAPGVPDGGPPSGPPPGMPAAGGPPPGVGAGGPPAGGPGGGGPPGGMPPGGGPPMGPPGVGAPGAPARRIPEFVPWTIAAIAIAVAVVVAVTSGGSAKKKVTRPPHAIQIEKQAEGTLPPLEATRTMANGTKLTLGATGTLAVVVQRITLQPGASEPWHTHPGSGLAIVETGQINDYEQEGEGCKLYVLKAGEDRFDAGSFAHTLVNPTKEPVVIWVTGFAPPGNPTALTPHKKPPKCSESR